MRTIRLKHPTTSRRVMREEILNLMPKLQADLLAEDGGVLYEDLGQLDQLKFYGTPYDYLANQMGQILRAQMYDSR